MVLDAGLLLNNYHTCMYAVHIVWECINTLVTLNNPSDIHVHTYVQKCTDTGNKQTEKYYWGTKHLLGKY